MPTLIAEAFAGCQTDPQMRAMAERAAAEARRLDDRLLESTALDALSVVHLAGGDVPGALAAVGRRNELLATARPGADNGIEISDAHAMASEIALTAGNLAAARRYADTLAALPYDFEEGHRAGRATRRPSTPSCCCTAETPRAPSPDWPTTQPISRNGTTASRSGRLHRSRRLLHGHS